FKIFIQSGMMIEADPHIVAMHFYSPMFLQILICDNHPEKEDESLKLVEEHIRQFNSIYFKENKSS
ncbi:MAG: TetR/AcrR family transcriptional regulator, partial [Coprobacillus sp.]